LYQKEEYDIKVKKSNAGETPSPLHTAIHGLAYCVGYSLNLVLYISYRLTTEHILVSIT